MLHRFISFIVFVMVIVTYMIFPFVIISKYVAPPEKKLLFQEAVIWKNKEPEILKNFHKERELIFKDTALSSDERRVKIAHLKKEWQVKSPFFQKGYKLHQRLLQIGVTPDVPLLIGIYFFVGILLFWLYRLRAKRAGVFSGRFQYTCYLFVLSILIIITTFGFAFTASYIHNPLWWELQQPIQEFTTPLEATPFIGVHFIMFALNAAAMGPLDHYMTIRPHSYQISLLQWIERLFVISVLFSSISRLWWKPSKREDESEDVTVI